MKFSKYNPEGYYDPDDRTDVGEALLLGRHFEHELRYPPATDYLRYDGSCWQEKKPGAQAVAHVPALAWLDSDQPKHLLMQLPILVVGIICYVALLSLAYRLSVKYFDRVNL